MYNYQTKEKELIVEEMDKPELEYYFKNKRHSKKFIGLKKIVAQGIKDGKYE